MCTELVLPSFRPIQKINPDMQWGDFHLQEDSAHAGRTKNKSVQKREFLQRIGSMHFSCLLCQLPAALWTRDCALKM